ncbi:allantoinase AllB [[Clostridium] hylemonae]|uniref:allantoinase AllB n=1 Tax=[Clostridium] hylemonae TaxID=89153 RepID=UPI0011060E98|nr:allantoinase AllB [[Clostridium] hylemonae]
MYDLAIEKGYVITAAGKRRLDIGISNGIIAGLSMPGMLGAAKESVQVPGRYIFPGGIDVHVHMDDLGADETEDWRHGSMAAAAGGITTVADMPIDNVPATVDRRSLQMKLMRIEGNSFTDYMVWGGLTADNLDAVMPMLSEGAAGLKAFLCDSGAEDFPRVSDPVLLEAMRLAAKENFPIVIHAENEEINNYYSKKLKGRLRWEDLSRMHPEESELEAVARCALFARITGAGVHIAHISSAKSIALIQEARRQGARITCETCPHYLMFSEEDYPDKGAMLKCAPPVRGMRNRDALWEELKCGHIDIISSDHSPSADKSVTDAVDRAWAGISGVQFTLPVLFSEGCCKRKIPPERIAEVLSLRPAELLGIDKSKGSIELGKDADLAVLNPEKQTIYDENQIKTKVKNSVYKDMCLQGTVERTFLRGAEAGGSKPRGRYICR